MSGWTLSAIAAPLVCLAAVARGDVVRDSTGYPGNPGYVSGGRVMNSYANGANYGVTAFRGLNLTQASRVTDIAGVMASTASTFNWVSNIQSIRINVFSSTAAFAASPLVGDIYSSSTGVSIENLVGTVPPAWGGTNFNGFVNRYVDLAFPPFTLPAGS